MRNCLLVMLGLVLVAGPICSPARAEDFTITISDWVAPDETPYEAKDKPPNIPANKDGITTPTPTGTDVSYDLVPVEGKNYSQIKNLKVTISGKSLISYLKGANDVLYHERKHDALNKAEYVKRARMKAEAVARAFVSLKIDNITDKDKVKQRVEYNFKTSLPHKITKEMENWGKKFDGLVDAGKTNDVSYADVNKEIVDPPKPQAIKDKKPDDGKKTTGIGDPMSLSWDADLEQFSFGGDRVLDFATDPSDTIVGRGEVSIDPTDFIGILSDGEMLMTDTPITITDSVSGGTLMSGLIVDPCYAPSSLPGYAGMIKGYLDVFPDAIGGINNTIGSDFLSSLGEARDAGQLNMVWYYTDQPLFDADGNVMASSMSGVFKMAVAVPEPGSLVALVSGLGLIALKTRRRRL